MKKTISLIFSVLLVASLFLMCFTSCMTPSRMKRICAMCPDKVEVKDSIIVKESIVKVPFYVTDSFTTTIENPCQLLCDSLGKLKHIDKSIKVDKNRTVTIRSNKLQNTLQINCQTDSLKKEIEHRDREITRLRTEKSVVKIPIETQKKESKVKQALTLFFCVSGGVLWLIVLFLAYIFAVSKPKG